MTPRSAVCLLIPLAVALASPCSAQAETRTMTLRYGPVAMGDFNVEFPKVVVRAPGVDGYVTSMHADLVDARGRTVTIRDVMLHHTVFFQRQRTVGLNNCGGRAAEAFYGTGEESQTLRLPAGYGYRTHPGSQWTMHAMLMSHSTRAMKVYVRYRVTVVTGRSLQHVRPFWVRASGCRITYPIWGGGKPGATKKKTFRWKVPMDGRIVATGGHLHGGSKDMWLTQPRCRGRRLLDTSPRYGMPDSLYYRAKPILHEPGPVETRYFLSRSGIPVRKGETIDLHAIYDNSQPHSRVMAIMHIYLAPGKVTGRQCAALPADARHVTRIKRVRTSPPQITIPLNTLDANGRAQEILNPPWPVRPLKSGSIVRLRNFVFSPRHVEIERGDSLVWSFDDAEAHNVTFASGPRLIRVPTYANGRRYRTKFTRPGRYELFCYLHPMSMHEIVDVKP